MRYRKNINCLSADELHDLREALAAMYALPAADPNSFATLASFHGGPPITYCAHGAPGFFTWHRAYLLAFENALRSVGCHAGADVHLGNGDHLRSRRSPLHPTLRQHVHDGQFGL